MGFWEDFFSALGGTTSDEDGGGVKMYLNSFTKEKCGTCANWNGARDISYNGIGTKYVIIFEDKAQCAAKGYSSCNNYHKDCSCREKGSYIPIRNF